MVAIDLERTYLITADISPLGREVLNKTDDRVVAKEHLNRLSGRRHHVLSFVLGIAKLKRNGQDSAQNEKIVEQGN